LRALRRAIQHCASNAESDRAVSAWATGKGIGISPALAKVIVEALKSPADKLTSADGGSDWLAVLNTWDAQNQTEQVGLFMEQFISQGEPFARRRATNLNNLKRAVEQFTDDKLADAAVSKLGASMGFCFSPIVAGNCLEAYRRMNPKLSNFFGGKANHWLGFHAVWWFKWFVVPHLR